MAEMDSGRIEFGLRQGPVLPEEDNMERIRRRAREIWEEEGRPEGQEDQHWRRAQHEVLGAASRSNS